MPAKISKSWKGLTEKRLKAWKKTRVHKGFDVAYGKISKSVETRLAGFLANTKKTPNTYCIGFSLGAAMATHCAAHVQLRFGLKTRLIVGASPRVGDEAFRKAFDSTIDESVRIMLEKDPVTQIPGNIAKRQYEHVGKQLLPMAMTPWAFYPEASLVKLAHHWSNSRPVALFVKFASIIITCGTKRRCAYSRSLRKTLQKGQTVELVRAERKASSEDDCCSGRQRASRSVTSARAIVRRRKTSGRRIVPTEKITAKRHGPTDEMIARITAPNAKAIAKRTKLTEKRTRRKTRLIAKTAEMTARVTAKRIAPTARKIGKRTVLIARRRAQTAKRTDKIAATTKRTVDRKEDRKENRADRKRNAKIAAPTEKITAKIVATIVKKIAPSARMIERCKCEKQCRKKKSKKAEKKCISRGK